ncbi:MAG: septum formation initiator family protein [Actinomycetota bacterium]
MISRRQAGSLIVLAVALVVIAYLAAVPARNYWEQRSATAEADAELDDLRAEIAELEARSVALEDDDEIERLAREEYHYVYPGEEAFVVLPAAPPPLPIPAGWPFDALKGAAYTVGD